MDSYERLREAMAMTFNVAADAITRTTTQADLEAWDSVGHLNLMLVLEDSFQLELDVDDMERLTSVESILAHLG